MTTPIGSSDGEREALPPSEQPLDDMVDKAWGRFEKELHRSHDKIVEMAGEVARKFEIRMGYGTWTDPAYRQDVSTWNAAWTAALSSDREMAATNDFDAEERRILVTHHMERHAAALGRADRYAEFSSAGDKVAAREEAVWRAAAESHKTRAFELASDREMAPEAEAKDSVNQIGAQGGEPEAAVVALRHQLAEASACMSNALDHLSDEMPETAKQTLRNGIENADAAIASSAHIAQRSGES